MTAGAAAGRVCVTPGCGSTDAYLDTSTERRATWVKVVIGARSVHSARWFCTQACAAAALGGKPGADRARGCGPMPEGELLRVWDGGPSRLLWQQVRAKNVSTTAGGGNPERVEIAEQTLADLPAPLVALSANAELVRRLTGARWMVIMLALEGGATWSEVAEALGSTEDEAVVAYTTAIDAQALYVPTHDGARARAVLPGAEQPGLVETGESGR